MVEFIPGKKYRYGPQGNIVHYIGTDDRGHHVGRFIKPNEHEFAYLFSMSGSSWEEIVEPKKGVMTILIRETLNGKEQHCVMDGHYLANSHKTIAKITVPWTEGEGL